MNGEVGRGASGADGVAKQPSAQGASGATSTNVTGEVGRGASGAGGVAKQPSAQGASGATSTNVPTTFCDLPASAAWRHLGARVGFEAVFISASRSGERRLDGHTAAVEEGQAWVVRYEIEIDARWLTRRARIRSWSASGPRDVELSADGTGHWSVGGEPVPELDGCYDVDLESSACTNALPVHRLALDIGEQAAAPAAYVRALTLDVERLEQSYQRLPSGPDRVAYDYHSPRFGFRATLEYDRSGLVFDYPGIARRIT